MFAYLTFFNFLTIITLTPLLLFVVLLVIIPWFRISAYKRDDALVYFFPVSGAIHLALKSLKAKGDIMGFHKEFTHKYPNKKVLVTNIGTEPMIHIRDTQYAKEFIQQWQFYEKARFNDPLKFLMGNGLVTAKGETWKRHRKIISGSFHYEFLKENMGLVQDTTREFLDKIRPEDCKNCRIINKVQEITGEIVGRIFFGKNLHTYTFEGKPLTHALAEISTDLGMAARSPLVFLLGTKVISLPIFPKYIKLLDRIKRFRQICSFVVRDRKANPVKSNDLLNALLATQNGEDSKESFSDENIVDEFITFFFGGMDTTGHLVGVALYHLTQHPELLKDLKKERDSTYNKEKDVSADALQKMEFLHAFLKETLRFHCPAPNGFIRTAKADFKLQDFPVKKGTHMRLDFFSLFFDEKHYDKPYEFNPRRWMDPNQKLDPYAFLPFSAGPRNCIGQHLAIIEAKVIISEFLERFEFKIDEEYKLKMTARFLYEPYDELVFQLTPIEKSK